VKRFRISLLVCVGLLGAAAVPSAKAGEWNKKTVVTFNEPVEIPGMVLGPGTYVFKLADSEADRDVVQIFNKAETHLYATILGIPDVRPEPTGKTVIRFEERAANSPEAVKAWFYPGDRFGEEFVYPKARAVQLAKLNKRPVPSMPSEMTENIKKPANTMKEPHIIAMKQAPLTAVTPDEKEVEIATVIPPPPPPQQRTQVAAARNLPKTGSPLPLIALLGLLAMAGGFSFRLAARRLRIE